MKPVFLGKAPTNHSIKSNSHNRFIYYFFRGVASAAIGLQFFPTQTIAM